MAITKMLHMKSAEKGSASAHLKNAIDYILKEEKVARSEFGIQYKATQDCFINYAYEDMMRTKQQYGKTDGRQGYHFSISFKPGEVTKEQLWSITQDFVKEYLPGYEVVYSLHDDKPHLHTHIIFNSVNYKTGLKYHYADGDWEKIIQPMVDRLCMKYGAPPLEYHIDEYDEDGVKKEQYHYSKNFNWTKKIKEDIDLCIQKSHGWEDFTKHMRKEGYTFNYGAHVSIRKPGMQRSRRLKENTVGLDYTPDGIIERIQIQNHDYRMSSVGLISSKASHLPDMPKRKKYSFQRFADMSFEEKALVKHMLRIRNAIPEYRITPGDWYVNRKVEELHRSERKLIITKKYDIHDMAGIDQALKQIGEQKKTLKKEEQKNKIHMVAWKDVLAAYETLQDLRDSYGFSIEKEKIEEFALLFATEKSEMALPDSVELLPEDDVERLKQALKILQKSGETMETIESFLMTLEENKKTITGEKKNLESHRRVLLSMKRKEETRQKKKEEKINDAEEQKRKTEIRRDI